MCPPKPCSSAEHDVSFVQLLAHPERFNGKEIIVQGVLTFQFENVALYLSSEQAKYHDTRSAVSLIFDTDKVDYERLPNLDGKHVRLMGKFICFQQPAGFIPEFAGEIREVRLIKEARTADSPGSGWVPVPLK